MGAKSWLTTAELEFAEPTARVRALNGGQMTVAAAHAHAPKAHVVQFYEGEGELIETVAEYLRRTLEDSGVAIVVATAAHMESFGQRLSELGVDVEGARAGGELVMLDAAETMSQFFLDGHLDAASFDATIGDFVRQASDGGRVVRIYGEMVVLLWEAAQVTSAMNLESLWNDLGQRVPFSLLCAYPASAVGLDADAFHELCQLHSEVVGPQLGGSDLSGEPAGLERTFNWGIFAPREARRFVAEILSNLDRPDLVDDALLVVSELATNAVVHARSPFTVTLSSDADKIKIAVRDGSPAIPELGSDDPLEPGGEGLKLVAAVCSRWGADLLGNGKVVWAELSARIDRHSTAPRS
jgi:hypothetical protein